MLGSRDISEISLPLPFLGLRNSFVGETWKSLKHWARKALKCCKQSLLSYSDLGWEFGRPEGMEKCKLWSPVS